MDLSVVVPSVNGTPIVLECLAALEADAASGVRMEVLVVDRCGEPVRAAIRARWPAAIVMPVPPGTSIPRMRAMAFARATAPAVAVIEDHVMVPRGWARSLLDALAAGADVAGGGVENGAVESLVDRMAFVCEYSHLLPPLPAGPVANITGNNVVYRRAALERWRAVVDEARWEDHLHAAMRRGGAVLVSHPEIVVRHTMHYRVRDYTAQRFWYARAHAGMRRADMSPAGVCLRAAGSLALPPVLLWRIVRRLHRTTVPVRPWMTGLPLLALFVCAWAAGEGIGYMVGGGDALSRVA
jgi:hypothetical protein